MNNIELMNSVLDPDKVPAWHNDFWTVTQEELDRYTEKLKGMFAELKKEIPLEGAHSREYEEGYWAALDQYSNMIKAQ